MLSQFLVPCHSLLVPLVQSFLNVAFSGVRILLAGLNLGAFALCILWHHFLEQTALFQDTWEHECPCSCASETSAEVGA